MLGKFTIRRLKEHVNANLPPKHDYYLLVDMYQEQKKKYEELSKTCDPMERRKSLLYCCSHPDIGKQISDVQICGRSGLQILCFLNFKYFCFVFSET